MNVTQESLEVPLVFAAGFVLRFLECGVADVDLALLAPESGLWLSVAFTP